MTDTAPTERAQRTCDGCGQTDDHPHHVIYAAISYKDPITQEVVTEDKSVSRHLDCCNCEICATDLEFTGGKRGLELADALATKRAEHLRALYERLGVESPGYERTVETERAVD